MFRNYLLILFLTVGLFSLQGCSLFSSENEEGGEAVTEESSDYSDDVMSDGGEEVVAESEDGFGSESADSTESMESSDSASTESSTEELAMNSDEEEVIDDYPDDDYGGGEEMASNNLPEQPMESEESLYVQGDQEPGTESISDTIVDSSSTGETAGFVPVKKMKRTPYNAGGVLLNRLYIARSGDTLSSVATKIYGDQSRSRDLANWNSSLRGKGLQVGDKVYYNSPRNPSDSSQILLYYEEVGIQPQYYTSQSGDSIRKVSQKLLGHPRSWMEIWATNEVESKWQVPQGTSLRYWPEGMAAAPVQQVAQVQAPPPTPQPAPEPVPEIEEQPMENNQEVAMGEEMMDEAPPASMEGDDMGAAGQVAQNQEPPPPPPNMAPPPPPPPTEQVAPPSAPGEQQDSLAADLMDGQDDTTMIAILGGLLLVAAFILLIFLKRSRKKVNYG